MLGVGENETPRSVASSPRAASPEGRQSESAVLSARTTGDAASDVSSEFLARRAQAGDADAEATLCARFERLAFHAANTTQINGVPHDDIVQLARMGILKAIRSWRPGGASVRNFAFLAIRTELNTAMREPYRGRSQIFQTATPLVDAEGTELPLTSSIPDPERVLLARVEFVEILEAIDLKLTPTERGALLGRAAGYSYDELGQYKVGDNGCQRARRKLRRHLASAELSG